MKLIFKLLILLILPAMAVISCGSDATGYPGNIREDFRGTWTLNSDGSYDGKKVKINTSYYGLIFENIPFTGDYSNNNFTGDFSDEYSDGVTSARTLSVSITGDSTLSGTITLTIKYPDSTYSDSQHFTGKRSD